MMNPKFKVGDRIRIMVGNLRGSYGEIVDISTPRGQLTFGVKTQKIDWPLFYYDDELQLDSRILNT